VALHGRIPSRLGLQAVEACAQPHQQVYEHLDLRDRSSVYMYVPHINGSTQRGRATHKTSRPCTRGWRGHVGDHDLLALTVKVIQTQLPERELSPL